jgi:N-acetyl-anhydromuramyl-L-alanine amidase AmpD
MYVCVGKSNWNKYKVINNVKIGHKIYNDNWLYDRLYDITDIKIWG